MKYSTEQRKRIAEYLEERKDEVVTAADIAAALSDTVSKSAVYRNLAALEEEGKVVRVGVTGERTAGYRYAASHSCKGKLHISCVKCGRTEHVSVPIATRFERAIEATDGFSLNSGECMLYGVCKECGGQDR